MRIGRRHIFVGSSSVFGIGTWWRSNLVSLTHTDVENCHTRAQERCKKPVVVIAGAGLTGCLTSYLLRKSLGDQINIHVMERSLYPSGRFGAGLRYRTCDHDSRRESDRWCDLGSQVRKLFILFRLINILLDIHSLTCTKYLYKWRLF